MWGQDPRDERSKRVRRPKSAGWCDEDGFRKIQEICSYKTGRVLRNYSIFSVSDEKKSLRVVRWLKLSRNANWLPGQSFYLTPPPSSDSNLGVRPNTGLGQSFSVPSFHPSQERGWQRLLGIGRQPERRPRGPGSVYDPSNLQGAELRCWVLCAQGFRLLRLSSPASSSALARTGQPSHFNLIFFKKT